MRRASTRLLGAVLTAMLAGQAESAWGCAACFGKSDSPMAQGMNMGIFTLLLVILSVLIGIAAFFAYIIRRAALLEAAANASRVNESASAPAEPPSVPEAHSI